MGGNGQRTAGTGAPKNGATKNAKPKEALEADKPNESSKAEKSKEASLQNQNLISNETNLAMLLTQVVEKRIQRPKLNFQRN